MIVEEWKLTTFVRREPWLDAREWGRPSLRAQRATPLVRGGASNNGSWRKNVVNSYISHGRFYAGNILVNTSSADGLSYVRRIPALLNQSCIANTNCQLGP